MPKRLFQKLIQDRAETPRVIVTDNLKNYAAANQEILPKVEHRQSHYLDNRAEASRQPTRRRDRPHQFSVKINTLGIPAVSSSLGGCAAHRISYHQLRNQLQRLNRPLVIQFANQRLRGQTPDFTGRDR